MATGSSTVTISATDSPGLPNTVWSGTDTHNLEEMTDWDLSHNQMTDSGFRYLMVQTEDVHSASITHIDLSYNYLSKYILAELSLWMRKFPNATVDIRNNAMTSDDIKYCGMEKSKIIIQGCVERKLQEYSDQLTEHTKQSKDRLDKYTQENLAKVMEESIIPFISKYLNKKGLTHQLVVNRDPDFKPRRELQALSYHRNKKCIKREYDGLYYIEGRAFPYLLCNASQLHLTRKKFDSIKKALNDMVNMVQLWRHDTEETPLRTYHPMPRPFRIFRTTR